ncbi:MAG TPA: riboflavin synthase [Saprospiraceae bacterium]|nr:riboflavin synthase [Saprospiraceae bacterium]
MFTGIIEDTGILKSLKKDQDNIILEVSSKLSAGLKPDQSVAHNGVCLTITRNTKKNHYVTVVSESLKKSNLSELKPGDAINLERAVRYGARMDGHMVTGHVDHAGRILDIIPGDGSTEIRVDLPKKFRSLIVEKGSVALNGISLTVARLKKSHYSVFIIPYTWEHTNLYQLQTGDHINVEYDILGKYIQRLQQKV